MSKKKRSHGSRSKKVTSARKRKIQAQRAYTAAKKGNDTFLKAIEAKKKNKRILRSVFIPLGGIAAAALIACVAAIFVLTADTIAEVGETPDLSRLDGKIGSIVCTEHDSAESVDTSELGERKVECIFYGFIRKNMTVSVVDTTAPTLEVTDLVIGAGDDITADDFVVSADDRTTVRVAYAGDEPSTDKAGEYSVRIAAEDEGGNVTERKAALTVGAEKTVVHIEFGTLHEDAAEICKNETGLDVEADLLKVDECGEYRIIVPDGEKCRVMTVNVSDTTAPQATALSFDIVLGEELEIDDILTDVKDASEVTVNIVGEPDFSEAGDCTVDIDLTDEWGNTLRVETPIRVHDIRTEATVEAGTPADEIIRLFFGDNAEEEKLEITSPIAEYTAKVGEHELEAKGEYSTIPLTLTVEDTVAPTLVLHDAIAFVGQAVTPETFVSQHRDVTKSVLSFAEEPRTDKPNDITVRIIAEDEAGNKTEASAKLSVQIDDAPPVIYGVSTVYVNTGESASYGNGVYAVDNADGMTAVTFDASGVNTSAAGTYYVTYHSTDKAGNTAEVKGAVIVSAITQATIDQLADGVLSYIITPGMSQREKAWAIYSWCTANIKYSTRTSYLMDRFIDGAYSGFKTRLGNCYIYYAVAASLLSRAGIENIEVHRNSTTNPHYWNLVKIDGAWYHFDTCPHYAQYPITSFLLTDAEMRNYSETQSIGYYDFDASLYPPTP